MARVNTKIGDIFSAQIDNKNKKYLQYIANDLTQLNSDVIRVFKTIYPIDSQPALSDIVKDEVDFYAHCVTKWGVKLRFWNTYGNSNDVGSLSQILFRDTNDYGHKLGDEPIRISNNWYVWHINDKDFTRVGKLEGKNRDAEIGVVIAPDSIIYRMLHGEYDFVYPKFE
jgi:hypothetical protein